MNYRLKRIMAAALASVMLAGSGGALMTQLPSAAVCAAETLTEGDYDYTVNDDDTVTITKYTGSSQTVEIPEEINGKRVTEIANSAFTESNIKSIYISQYVTKIQYSFQNCTNLEEIVVDSANSQYNSGNGCNCIIRSSDNTLLVGCKSTSIPGTVTTIGQNAFYGCSGLTQITIPESVTYVQGSAFANSGLKSVTISKGLTRLDNSAFRECNDLESIVVDSSNSTFDSRDNCNAIIRTAENRLEVGCKNTIIPESVTGIGQWAFWKCGGLTEITIPNSVISIGYGAFQECSNLFNVKMSENLHTIGNFAFQWCTSLVSIEIPLGVSQIGEGAFEMCQSLKDVNYPGSESDWENITIETRNDVLSSEQVTIHYGVASTPVTEDMVTLSPTSYTYDGTAKTPDVTVTDGENTLRANVDYTVSYSNNINAGTGKVIINGKGTYKGTVEVPFTINPSALSACTVADIGNYGYTGSAITPPVIVLDGETVLKEDRDYTVSYDNNIAAGKATVTITGKGNYTGSLQKNFLITKEAELITAGTITLSASSVTYTGSAQKPAVTVKLGTKILKGGTDYDVRYSENTNVGTAGVTVTGKGNYSGTVQKTFKINPKAVSGTTATLSSTSYVYSGAAKSPAVAVKDGTKTLVKGTDYTVAYTNNTKAGTATVTITGKGNYGGTLKKTFTIKPRAISNTTATISKSIYLYTGSAVNPAVTVKDGTKTLTKGTDYTVSYSNNTKVGTATVTITGKGNYTGTLKKTFAIKKNFAKTSAALSATSYTYNGKAKTPSVTVKDGTKTLTKGTDYTVSYSNNTNVGTAAATITGKGNYSGTLKKTYKIVPAIPAVPAVENSASGLKVTWKKPAGAGGYYIYRSKDGSSDTKVKTITSGATLTWNDTGATANGSKYSYKVMAYKTVGEKTYKSAYSPAKVSYKISKPSLSLSNISQGVKLTVSKNGKATGYQMQISTLSDFSKKAEQKFTKTTWKIKLPDKIGKKCYLRVRTYKTVGSNTYYSVWSTVKSIVVKQ